MRGGTIGDGCGGRGDALSAANGETVGRAAREMVG